MNQTEHQTADNAGVPQPGESKQFSQSNSPVPADKPKPAMTDAEAQALLAIHGAQVAGVGNSKPKVSLGLVITVATLVLLAVLASLALGSFKSGNNTSQPNSSNQSNSPTNNTSNQINNDVKSCSNPEIAISEC
jgi:hypothetical protein